MNRISLYILSMISLISLIFFSCRKDIDYYLSNKEQASSSQLEMAKIWRLRHLSASKSTHGILQPMWDYSWKVTSPEGQLIIVPAPEHRVNNKTYSIRRFFVFTTSGNQISNGKIVELVGENWNIDDQIDLLLKSTNKSEIKGFTGIILNYDINYQRVSSITFVNGIKSKINSELRTSTFNESQKNQRATATGTGDCTPIYTVLIGFPPSYCSGAIFLSRLDWVADEDGCLLSATDTYITHTCPSANGGGSNSGGGQGSGSGGATDNPPYGGPPPTSGGGVNVKTSIKFPWTDRVKYPVLAKIIDGLYDKVLKDAKLMKALREYSNLTDAQILFNLTSGQGPEVDVVTTLSPNVVAAYRDGTNIIKINSSDANLLNTFEINRSTSTALEFFMTSLILYEFVHFGNDVSGQQVQSVGNFDAGAQFENAYYRGDVKYDPVLKDVFLVKMPVTP